MNTTFLYIKKQFIPCLLLLILGCSPLLGWSQNYQVEFGKNRLQDDHKDWKEYQSEHFVVHWSEKNEALAQSTIQLAEWDYLEVQKILEHRINRKIHFIVYSDIKAYKESNVGHFEPLSNNNGGLSKLADYRVPVYYNGNHQHLRKQIRKGIARVYVENMMLGSSFQEILQNAVLLYLPSWFTRGLEAYVGEKWNTDLDHQLKDIFRTQKYKDFDSFAYAEPELAGQSMWYYLGANFGQSALSNIVYLTRINRRVDGGFLYVLGLSYRDVKDNWKSFYQERYTTREQHFYFPSDSLKTAFSPQGKVYHAVVHPSGNHVAYVENYKGQVNVWKGNLKENTKELLFKKGFKNRHQITDVHYPLLSWTPQGKKLGILYQHQGKTTLTQIDIVSKNTQTTTINPLIQRIHSLEFIDAEQLLITATVNGQSDIFMYSLPQNKIIQRVTNDRYDDISATSMTLDGKQGIMFVSNRGEQTNLHNNHLDTSLMANQLDLYFLALEENNKELVRITDTSLANECQSIALGNNEYLFLSDRSGTRNIYQGKSSSYHALTNYATNVVSISPIKATNQLLIHLEHHGASHFYKLPLEDLPKVTPINTAYIQYILKKEALRKKVKEEKTQSIIPSTTPQPQPQPQKSDWTFDNGFSDTAPPKISTQTKEDTVDFVFVTDYFEENKIEEKEEPIDIDNYDFKNDFGKEEDDTKEIASTPTISFAKNIYTLKNKKVHSFDTENITEHKLRFKVNTITAQLDNGVLFGGIDNYVGSSIRHVRPSMLLKNQWRDVLENHELEVGVRLPITFDGLDYFVTLRDRKQRLNKEYTFFRKSNVQALSKIDDIPSAFLDLRNRMAQISGGSGMLRYSYALRDVSNVLQARFQYPLSIYSRFQATTAFRINQVSIAATDLETLQTNNFNSQRLSLGLEYIYDNTRHLDTNLKEGTRLRLYSEVHQRTNFQPFDGFKMGFKKGLMTVLGADIRHYLKLGKHAVLAGRISGATSLGSEKMLFNFGGADSELFPSTNSRIPLPSPHKFAYQTLVTSMRGFHTNTRNGNSYFLGNVELRVPLFKYLYKRTIRSVFLRHFQIVGFFDIGTAWQGSSPFNNNNPLNTAIIAPPLGTPQVITVEVNYFRDPILAAYGLGVRSKVFGYYIRLDYATGIETRSRQDGMWHISLGTDF